MKVVVFNGSPKKDGNTYKLIESVVKELEKENVDAYIKLLECSLW